MKFALVQFGGTLLPLPCRAKFDAYGSVDLYPIIEVLFDAAIYGLGFSDEVRIGR